MHHHMDAAAKARWRDRKWVMYSWAVFAIILVIVGQVIGRLFDHNAWWTMGWAAFSGYVCYRIGIASIPRHFTYTPKQQEPDHGN